VWIQHEYRGSLVIANLPADIASNYDRSPVPDTNRELQLRNEALITMNRMMARMYSANTS